MSVVLTQTHCQVQQLLAAATPKKQTPCSPCQNGKQTQCTCVQPQKGQKPVVLSVDHDIQSPQTRHIYNGKRIL